MSTTARAVASESTSESAVARLRGARRDLTLGMWLSAVLWGGVVTCSVLLALFLAADVVPLRGGEVRLAIALAVGGGLGTAAWRLRSGARPSLVDAALWIESRTPSLRYALVTVADLVARGDVPAASLTRDASAGDWSAVARRTAVRAVALPFGIVCCVALAAVVAAVHATAADARRTPAGAFGGAPTARRGVVAARGALASLAADVVPPPYTGLPRRTIDQPSTIAALAGSGIVLRGTGDRQDVSAAIGDAKPAAAAWTGGGWTIRLTMPPRTVAVRLADATTSRVVVLESVRDSTPVVVLTSPARDSVLRVPAGQVELRAGVTDDFGIASAHFEFIVSSGEGESFTFRSGVLGAVTRAGRATSLRAVLRLDSLGLKPGDLVHLRAVARDANSVAGPSTGSSETRTLRVMRAGEADSIAVEAAAPPEVDRSVVSQRMLVLLTEALEKRRPKLARTALLDEAHHISVDQVRLRKSIGEIVFSRLGGQPSGEESSGDQSRPRTPDEVLRAAEAATSAGAAALDFEGDETPVVSVNRPLLEAYNAMWDAGRALDAGEPARAIPPMRIALAAIERARQAERIYLRGRPPAVVVDVERARRQGRDRGQGSVRLARPAADPGGAARAARFARALAALGGAPGDALAAVDSLQLLRVDALETNPRAAVALRDAVDLLRSGRDATAALVRARRLLDGGTRAAPVGAWGRTW